MKCLIIAAGQGSRLTSRGDSKPLITLGDRAMIEWIIHTAYSCGISDFLVITGYNSEKIKSHLLNSTNIPHRGKVKLNFAFNEMWKKENGLSVFKAKEYIKEKFILLMADHLFDRNILLNIQNETMHEEETLLAVDFNIKNNPNVDRNDATKVQVENGRITAIGKNITDYDAYDTGIFHCSPAIFSALEESINGGDSTLAGGMRILSKNKKAKAMDIGQFGWIDIDDEKAFRKAEKMLPTLMKKIHV